ncbi:protein SRC2 homolog [Quercus lobata]|uniref:protein SRC2 homolog n=1 Tax=Quercus lobata TaxID=97700 RepID=UPI001246B52A|nr:protein SRC2 homolog [Quercus lobata]
MECWPLDITLNSAKDLKDLNLFSKMDLYAIVSIHGDYFNNNTNNANQQRMHINKDYGPNPKWNFPMKFTIDVSAVEQNRLALVVKIKAKKKLTGDKEVGEAHMPIKELHESYGEESKDERRTSYNVKTQKAEGPEPSER